MNRYQLKIQFKTETAQVLYVDENRVLDMLDAYAVHQDGVKLEDGKAVDGGWVATWTLVEGQLIVCPCRCNELVKAEGKFRPGHDARLVGNLLRQVRDGRTEAENAVFQLRRWPKLQEKLIRYLEK